MNAAIDTSVAVPLLVTSHEAHATVMQVVGGLELALPEHALIETYSVLTRLPGDARVELEDAAKLLDMNFRDVLAPRRKSVTAIHRFCAVHDALVAMAAKDHDVLLLTRDKRASATYDHVESLGP